MDQIDIFLEEYRTLRNEQIQKMNHRVTLITASVTASAALIGFGLNSESNILLVVPIISCIFGLLVLATTSQILELGDYLRRAIEPRINNKFSHTLGWHIAHRGFSYRFTDTFGVWHFPMLLTVIAPSGFSLFMFLFVSGKDGASIGGGAYAIIVVDALFIIYYVVSYALRLFGGQLPRRKSTDWWLQEINESKEANN